ncbi:type II toxin-antitoxin system RelE/ParE family toxin [Rhodovibrio salinarum]|uniref:Type II toxin-antitoxin system RelE/ParE family toxin n=1 Tax=Rhodovibrio salinarum TaxID=1087 RepID=A0A934QI71_9PROT|nr:type II toxin-antitoxin system RelE/ParE family toxin [Rhodovibrio salinarum]MBK1697025.1 type II toxin-antitoxin system RelE/ParE family toxin [Rhodovibrio salinarum]
MRVIWSRKARRDLEAIQSFIGADNPEAADRVENAVVEITRRLASYPRLGHLQDGGFREIIEPRYRYIVRYDVFSDDATAGRVHILSIWHPKQTR